MKKIILLFLAFITIIHFSNAQWQSTNGPGGGQVLCLATDGTNIFAGTYYPGVFLSTNNGSNWTLMNSGLTNTNIYALAIDGTKIYAGTRAGIFVSNNNGVNWTLLGLATTYVTAIAKSGANIFVGTESDGIYLSNDSGLTWISANTGLDYQNISSLAIQGTNIYAGTWGGVIVSTNNGASWTATNLTNCSVNAISIIGTNIFAGTYSAGVLLSNDSGSSWTAVNNGLLNYCVYALAASGTNIYAGTWGGGVFLSNDYGANWISVNTGLDNAEIFSLAVNGTDVFAGTYTCGVYISTDNGANWNAVNNGIPHSAVRTLANDGSGVYAGTEGGVFYNANDGSDWLKLNTGYKDIHVYSFVFDSVNIFAGTNNGVLISTNNGANWSAVSTGLTDTFIVSLTISGSNIFAGTNYQGIFMSSDNGANWLQTNSGMTGTYIADLAVIGTNIFASTNHGPFLSSDNGANWTQINSGLPYGGTGPLAVKGTNIFIGTSNGVYASTNNGANWSSKGLTGFSIYRLIVCGTCLVASSMDFEGIYLSPNNGASWISMNAGLPYNSVLALTAIGTDVYAGVPADGAWKLSLLNLLVIDAGNNPVIICGDSVNLNATVTYLGNDSLIYSWTPAIGLSAPNIANPIANPMTTTTYYITVSDSIHSAMDSLTIYINPLITPHINLNGNILSSNKPNGNQWYRNDTLIPGATNQSYNVSVNGYYYDIIYWNGCISDTSNVIYYGNAGINEAASNNGIFIYPNPATNNITISTTQKSEIEILNINGQIIKSITHDSGETSINIRDLSSGVYIVRAKTDKEIVTKKIIKQ